MLPSPENLSGYSFTLIRPPDRHYRFEARLHYSSDDLIVIAHDLTPSKPLKIDGRTVIDAGYHAIWFLLKDCRYDIGKFFRPDGTWTGYYVDALEPVTWSGSDATTLVPLVDLFLDLWVTPYGGDFVLDRDEFETAVQRGWLSSAQAENAERTISEVRTAVHSKRFPPDAVTKFLRESWGE